MKVLTISIAAYNIDQFLKETLDRLLSIRNTEKMEILVVSDGSTDQTETIAAEYERRYPGIVRLISKANGGWGSTVNTAIRAAAGKYLKLLDGDDYFMTENLDEFIEFLAVCEADAVISPYRVFLNSDGRILSPKTVRREFSYHHTFGPEEVTGLFTIHEICIRTDLLRSGGVRLSKHCFYTDVAYVAKAMCLAKTLKVFPKTIYLYRIGADGQSTSAEGFIRHRAEHFRVIRAMDDLRRHYDPTSDQYRLVTDRLGSMVKKHYHILLSIKPGREILRELLVFDRWTRENCPDAHAGAILPMKAVRASRYLAYPVISILVRMKLEVFYGEGGRIRSLWYG